MANFEIDEEPMPSEGYAQRSDDIEDSNFQRHVSRTESASLSIPIVSMDREASLAGHSGPLHSMGKTPFPQISGPLYATHRSGSLLQHSRVVTGNEVVENRTEKFSTFRGTGENHSTNLL